MLKKIFSLFLAVLILVSVPGCAGTRFELVGIRVKTQPDKLEYFEGESFERQGMTVVAVYSDGIETPISTYAVDKSTLNAGDSYVTVSYKGFTARVSVTVSSGTLSGIYVRRLPDKVTYIEGERFDRSGMYVVGRWSDGSERQLTDYVVDKDVLSTSDTTVRVLYGEWVYDIEIMVLAKESAPMLILRSEPVRQIYVSGERFDATGLIIEAESDGRRSVVTDYTIGNEPLAIGQTSVRVEYLGAYVDVPVSVVYGEPLIFESVYTEAEYDACFDNFVKSTGAELVANNSNDSFLTYVMLNRPDENVTSFVELCDAVDFHAFYHVDSIVIRMNYSYSSLEEEMNRLYFASGILASNVSIKAKALSDGYVHIRLKFYDGDYVNADNSDVILPRTLEPDHTPTRSSDYTPPRLDCETGVTVYNSEQVAYALTHGYSVAPVPGSPADRIVRCAVQILCERIDDDMDEFEKMYSINMYFLNHALYDTVGEELAGQVLDPQYESDMLASRLVSFHAEGPLLYGNSACYGFAKASAILLGLEGMNIRRTVAKDDEVRGRSAFKYDTLTGGYDSSISLHSFLYVDIDSHDYIFDVTFAYAGSTTVGGMQIACFRDLSIGLDKENHAQVYVGMNDPISSGTDYRPANFNYIKSFTYDGVHPFALTDKDELEKYLEYAGTLIGDSRGEYLAFDAFVLESGLDYMRAMLLIEDFCRKYSTDFFRVGYMRTIEGERYLEFIVSLRT